MQWFRMYAEFLSDPVVQSLSFEDQRHYVAILCLKCNGTLDRELASSARERIIYRGIGLDPINAEEVKKRLLEVGLIDKKWHPKGWDKRQYKSDDVTQRTRKHKKTLEVGNVPEPFEEQRENVPRVRATDTEQNRDRESVSPKAHRLTLTDLPGEWEDFAQESGVRDIPRMWLTFRDHWAAKPGKDGTKLDWFATWRNWVRRDFGPKVVAVNGSDFRGNL